MTLCALLAAAQIGGVFPLLCTPYSEDGSLDCETLAKEARFVADCGADGVIWPAANDAMKWLSPEEERSGLEAVAAALDGRDVWFSPCCPGTNTTDMLHRVSVANEISAKHPGFKMTMLVRMLDDAKGDADYERQYGTLAAATRLPVIIQTYNGKSPMPSAKLLIDLAKRHPQTYGWYKVEGTGSGIVPCARALVAAKPVVKTVFTGWGGRDWLYHYRRVGTRGVITQRPMYADLIVKTWRALEAEGSSSDELFAKFMYLRNLEDAIPAPEMRGWNLYVLKKRGIFRNTLSRTKRRDDGSWEVKGVELPDADRAEVDARLGYALNSCAMALPPAEPIDHVSNACVRVDTFHATPDVVLAERVAGAPAGDADFSAELQSMLDDVGSRGGGTVFLHRGFYTIARPVEIPVGVTLRGDYSAARPDQSTILRVVCGRGDPNGTAAFTVNCGGGLMGLVFWYPEQRLEDPAPYPWTVRSKIGSPLPNENQTVTDCTFVNSWKAVAIGPEWNELHTLRRLSICSLSTGFAIDRTSDIGRTSEVLVSPNVWSASGLPGAPSEKALREWLRTHETIGADYARSDWEYIWRLKVDGYNVGARFRKGVTPILANAAMAESVFTNCVTGLRLVRMNPVGLAVHDSVFASDTNVAFTSLWNSVQFSSCRFIGSVPVQPVKDGHEWSGHLMLSREQDSGSTVRPEPPSRPRPTGSLVVDVRDFGAATNLEDNTSSFMRALAKAGQSGGTVYVPAGVWKIRGALRVPTGVELRGCSDVPHHTTSGGSVLLAYSGRGNEDGDPLISLEPRSGLRGLGVWYPEQMFYDPVPYPWAVRSLGEGCWITDVNIANCWNGVDFASHPSDGHRISYLSGGFWRRGLAVGKCSSRGWVEDVMMNPHYTVRRQLGVPHRWGESKDERFRKMPAGEKRLHAWLREHLEAYAFTDCADEHVRGIFVYAARTGIRIDGKSRVTMLLPGCDTAVKCFSVRQDEGSKLNVALAQLVPRKNGIDDSASVMLEKGDAGDSGFTATQTWTSRSFAEEGSSSFVVQRGNGCAVADMFVSDGIGKSCAESGRLAIRNGMYIDHGPELAMPSNGTLTVSECSVGQFNKAFWHGASFDFKRDLKK